MKKEQTPIKLVYAAPAFMRENGADGADEPAREAEDPGLPYPANYEEPADPDADTLMEDVYNGPEMPDDIDCAEPEEGEKPEPSETEVPMAPVYAGPEFFEERGRRFSGRRKAMECVYAGPDYFAARDGRAPRTGRVYAAPAPDPKEKDQDQNDRRKLMQGVYAVPGPVDNSQLMMAVYAGPEIMSNPNFVSPGAFCPDPAKKPADLGYCPICGGKVSETANFCETCGAKLERSEAQKPEQPVQPAGGGAVCPNCGAAVPAGSPFCHECGTPVPKATAEPESAAEPEKPEQPKDDNVKNEPVFRSVYACPPVMKKGGKEPLKKGLFSNLFKKEKK